MYGHAWHEISVTALDGRRTFVEMVIECLRCGGLRVDTLNRTEGSVQKRRYTNMPADYYIPGPTRYYRQEFRAEHLRNVEIGPIDRRSA